MTEAGIYTHIPFCKSRCSYCDFATDVYRSDEAVTRYVAALVKEVAAFQSPEGGTQNIDTIYFGGGTPSLLSAGQVEQILAAVGAKFSLADGAEVTLEMNPATVTPEKLKALRSLGVNRASFGVQTFDDRALRMLARGHDAADARNTFDMLRRVGFDNISFDLIAGLPHQTLKNWEQNLNEALAMQPEHLSLYLLEIHEGTPLAEQARSGRQPLPDEDLSARMYELMLEKAAAAGYAQYEISNFSRPGRQSRHNLKYWRFEPYYAFGCSAHSFDGIAKRWSNERDTNRYLKLIEEQPCAVVEETQLDERSRRGEYAFLRLRLNEGLSRREYKEKFGRDVCDEHRDNLQSLNDSGLIEITEDRVKLTPKGMVLSNEVFSVFV
jgi:oxygen-independent coproporphyrinogen-3 oxidase